MSGLVEIVLVMGVAGSGKSTLARALAERLGWHFLEGDDLHPADNIARMSAGLPLTDADREPWLAAIAAWMADRASAGEDAVVACSALKRRYRDVLRSAVPDLRIVHLQGGREVIAGRLADRTDHFMPPHLLGSQFDALEPPGPDERAVSVPVTQPIEQQVQQVLDRRA